MRFRERSPEVDAIQFNNTTAERHNREIFLWLGGEIRWKEDPRQGGYIRAVQGDLEFSPGDWLVRDEQGRIFPVDARSFAKIYERV